MSRPLPLLALLLFGCGGPDAGEVPVGEVAVRGVFRVQDFHTPIEEVVVCEDDPEGCWITDATGAFSWTFPGRAQVRLDATHRDFVPVLLPFATGTTEAPPVDVDLWPIEQFELTLQAGGADWPPGTGGLLLSLRQLPAPPAGGEADPGVADAVVEVGVEGVRTRYFDATGDYLDSVLSASTGSGLVAAFGIPPGTHPLTVTPDSGACGLRELGWPATLPFEADRLTLATWHCAPD